MNPHLQLESVFGPIEQSSWLAQAEKWKHALPWKKYAQQIALEVLEHLDRSGKSQHEFAAMMGVAPQTVNQWLSGKVKMKPDTIAKIELALGLPLLKCYNPTTLPDMPTT